jgi:hypothetical protein
LLTVKTRRALFGRLIDLLDWGRAAGPLRDMSAAFIRQHHHTIADIESASAQSNSNRHWTDLSPPPRIRTCSQGFIFVVLQHDSPVDVRRCSAGVVDQL